MTTDKVMMAVLLFLSGLWQAMRVAYQWAEPLKTGPEVIVCEAVSSMLTFLGAGFVLF